MKITDEKNLEIQTKNFTFTVLPEKPGFVRIVFQNGIGAEFFVASGCDTGDMIDELVDIGIPQITENQSLIQVKFNANTTIWEKVEYIFDINEERIVYYYNVYGSGNLENVRFFEGFLQNDPRKKERYYPYFCGPGRHMAYHRNVKEFMQSSKPLFSHIYTYGITSLDKRILGFYEDMNIRINGDRHYYAGDWLATPSPFLFLMGDKEKDQWVTLGLAVKPGENRFMGYRYCGGAAHGLWHDG